jgi:hypothetical protein
MDAGANNFSKHISESITKFELIDGSEVLISLSGSQLDAIPYFVGNPLTINKTGWEQSSTHYFRLVYDFGRWLFDGKYALDPAKLTNPQLRITYDATNVSTGGGSFNLQIDALVFDELVAEASMFLSAKQIKEYAPSNNAWEYSDLPTDYAYRLLLVQAYNPGKTFNSILSDLRLSEDNDKKIPYDVGAEEQALNNALHYGRLFDSAVGNAQTSDRDWMSRIGKYLTGGYFGATEANLDNLTVTEAAKVTIGASTGSFALTLNASGFCPHSIVSLPVGDPRSENDWYNVQGIGNLQLQLKGAGSAASNAGNPRIVVQQARGY